MWLLLLWKRVLSAVDSSPCRAQSLYTFSLHESTCYVCVCALKVLATKKDLAKIALMQPVCTQVLTLQLLTHP